MNTRISRRVLIASFVVSLAFSQNLFAQETDFPSVDQPQKKLFVGEKLVYTIHYLGVPVGKAEAEVKEIAEIRGRKAYHIVVHVRSYRVIDFIYKVRDEHHSFVDVEKLHSLEYEKILQEGFRRTHVIITFDQERHTAHYFFPKKKSEKEMVIPENVQDELSCGYYFRTLSVEPNTSVLMPVNADQKNWSLEVKLYGVLPMKIERVGQFQALAAEPFIPFRGIFVKRGKIRGWISLDDRRIPLKMKVKVPVLGNVVAELSDYHPGEG